MYSKQIKLKEMKKILKTTANMLAIATFAVMLTSCKETEDNNEYTAPVIEIRSLKLSSNVKHLVAGEKDTLTVTFRPEDAPEETFAWISSDDNIASISPIGALSGEVRALTAGTAIITVKTAKGVIDICEVTVTKLIPLTGISISPSGPIRIETGRTDTLYSMKGPANATSYQPVWTSNNPAVATVSESGVITAVSIGTAVVTVSSGNVSSTVNVEVVAALEGLSITPAEPIALERLGATLQLNAAPFPANSVITNPVWTSSNPNVVSVSQTGLATAIGTGTTTVTITSDNIRASVEITVTHTAVVEANGKYSTAGWTAAANSVWGDGNEAKNVFDGDTGTKWHSDLSNSLPQCLVVDMKSSNEVDRIDILCSQASLAGGDNGAPWVYFGTIRIYLSNEPASPNVTEPQASWGNQIATYNFDDYGQYVARITLNTQHSQGRYLILYFPDSRAESGQAPYMSVDELEVYKNLQ
jgi:uncharacterized protein YjdB